MFLWVELPEPISTSLSLAAAEHDLQLTPGPRFAAAGVLERHLRLPFTLAPAQLERAVEILAGLTPSMAGLTPTVAGVTPSALSSRLRSAWRTSPRM